MSFDEFRRRADAVRDIPLEAVLTCRGAVRDRRDRARWHTERGPLSVTGAKFTNWHGGAGGGAIDLVMHLAQIRVSVAVQWLEQYLAASHPAPRQPTRTASDSPSAASPCDRSLRLPTPEARLLDRVRRYLTQRRGLSATILESLIQSGKLYADRRGNAVFLLVAGKAQQPVGAELRGTGPRVWRGMAPGSRKDLGYFWLGTPGSQNLILCESAIDAISYFQMHPPCICISTAGVRANPRWLRGLLDRGYALSCGFDADEPGDAAATQMIAWHPAVQRLRPPAHDWNDVLTSRR